MGICQSSALKVIVYDFEKRKRTHTFSMKKLRTFRSIGDVLILTNVELDHNDKIYYQIYDGLKEIQTHSQFQIRNLIVKNDKGIKYKIYMESMY